MRKEFGEFITELAGKDDKVVLIVGDIGFGIFDEFMKKFPERFFNFGLCEQSMISAASGMALQGLKPYVYTITPFLTDRPFEQIKIDINQQKANVKLVGYADYPNMGPTHDELAGKEEIMKHFTNITSFFPKSTLDAKEAFIKASEINGPTFISLKKPKD